MKWIVQKRTFIQAVVSEDLIVSGRKKVDIESDMDPVFEKKDGSFGYLLNLSLMQLTSEKIDILIAEEASLSEKLEAIRAKTGPDMYIEDLEKLRGVLV